MTTLKDIKNIVHDAAVSPGRLCCLPVMDVKRLIAVADAAETLCEKTQPYRRNAVIAFTKELEALRQALEESK